MMRYCRGTRLLAVAVMSCMPVCLQADAAPSIGIEAIVAQHIAALGGLDRIHAIRNRVIRGRYNEGDLHLVTYIAQERPFFRVIGDPDDPKTDLHEGYDGGAWEWYRDPGLVVRTGGAAAATTRHSAMFDDVLVDHAGAGTKLNYRGTGKIEGKAAHVVRALLADGAQMDVYVDIESHMIDAVEHIAPMHAFGKLRRLQELADDYRPEAGVMMAHRHREIDADTGEVIDSDFVDSVAINTKLPRSIFSPPDWKRTQLQEMIQRIYDERDDPDAVMATYRDFRPLVPKGGKTADAVDFAGYQCLKMGQTQSAVALLTQNVADNPGSARAHFGLGRALQKTGKIAHAKQEMTQALKLDPQFQNARKALDALR
jgi:hypothetical protein